MKYLVEELHADVNTKNDKGYTPLHGAALIGRDDVIMYLIEKGADIKARATQISGSAMAAAKQRKRRKVKATPWPIWRTARR